MDRITYVTYAVWTRSELVCNPFGQNLIVAVAVSLDADANS